MLRLFFGCTFIFFSVACINISAQGLGTNTAPTKQWVPEIYVGKIVPNYLNYPRSSARIGIGLTYLYQKNDPSDAVVRYYKNPQLGLHFGFHRLGNSGLFGNQIDLIPILNLPTKKGSLQFGLGLAYFTKNYRDNPENEVIGSSLTWSFQSIYYRNFRWSDERMLRIGFGYLHGSNGHTQLPNFGINSAVLIVGLVKNQKALIFEKASKKLQNRYYLSVHSGIGYHEFGGTSSPVYGPKKAVYTSSLQFGIQFKGQFRWHMGFGARKYMHYADSIAKSPTLQDMGVTANNIYFTTGIEYLIYHFAISIDGGINLYKPFFKHFSKRYETTGNWQYTTKKLFMSRVGLRCYLINTVRKPKHNLYVASYLNANFGQADFSELTFGYIYRM